VKLSLDGFTQTAVEHDRAVIEALRLITQTPDADARTAVAERVACQRARRLVGCR
jgi:hypothetical protein